MNALTGLSFVPPVIASTVSVDWTTFVAQIVNFAVLVYLLKRFLYGPITAAMDRREQSIADRLDDATERRDLAEGERARYAALIAEHERTSSELLRAARDEAEATRADLLQTVRADVDGRRMEWEESFERERAAMIEGLRSEIGRRVVDATECVLASLADDQLQERIVAVFLARLREHGRELLESSDSGGDDSVVVRTTFDPTPDARTRVRSAIAEVRGHAADIRFETTSELICGIELATNGHAIEWSVDEFLSGFRTDRDTDGERDRGRVPIAEGNRS